MQRNHLYLLLFAGAFTIKTGYDTWLKTFDSVTPKNKPPSHKYLTYGFKYAVKGTIIPILSCYISNFGGARIIRYGIVSGAVVSITLEASDRISSLFSGDINEKSFHFNDFENSPDKFRYMRDVLMKTVCKCLKKFLEPEDISIFNPLHYFICTTAFAAEQLGLAFVALSTKPLESLRFQDFALAFVKPITQSAMIELMTEIADLADDGVDAVEELLEL